MNLDADFDFKKITAGGLLVNQYNEVLLIFEKIYGIYPKVKLNFMKHLKKLR